MSYDIRLRVKVEGIDKYVSIARPEYDSPTYNLRDMFVACTGWNYSQGENYQCSEVIEKIEHGIAELRDRRFEYYKYNPKNGWGNIDDAYNVLMSMRECIYETSEDYEIPLTHLYIKW